MHSKLLPTFSSMRFSVDEFMLKTSQKMESIYLKTQQYHSGIYPKDVHAYHKDIYSTMFIVEFFLIARTRKITGCPSTEEWIKNCDTLTQWSTTQQ